MGLYDMRYADEMEIGGGGRCIDDGVDVMSCLICAGNVQHYIVMILL